MQGLFTVRKMGVELFCSGEVDWLKAEVLELCAREAVINGRSYSQASCYHASVMRQNGGEFL